MNTDVEIVSRWNRLIDGLQASSLDFYDSLEEALAAREIPDIQTSRVAFREGGVLSAKREYFRVTRKEFTFDVCAALFGRGFFVSWWLFTTKGCLGTLAETPVLGLPFRRFVHPVTYWFLDTAMMFQGAVHAAVLEVVDQQMEHKGIRALSELERKPIMKEYFMS